VIFKMGSVVYGKQKHLTYKEVKELWKNVDKSKLSTAAPVRIRKDLVSKKITEVNNFRTAGFKFD